jgi:hypothetical protein
LRANIRLYRVAIARTTDHDAAARKNKINLASAI